MYLQVAPLTIDRKVTHAKQCCQSRYLIVTSIVHHFRIFNILTTYAEGRAIAEAVTRWLPNAAARVRARVWSCGICGGQSGAVAGFLRVFRFPLPIFIPPIAPQSPSSIFWGLYNRPEVAALPSPTPLKIQRMPHSSKCYYETFKRYVLFTTGLHPSGISYAITSIIASQNAKIKLLSGQFGRVYPHD
jgi:hypothetical protein